MARLSLTLLGGFQARLEPGSPLALPTKKAQALLAYLAIPVGQAHPRDKLATLLWGGIRDESARASLRQALFAIRKALGETKPSALMLEGERLALNRSVVDVDVATFAGLVAEGTPEALAEAAALYQGDLLAPRSLRPGGPSHRPRRRNGTIGESPQGRARWARPARHPHRRSGHRQDPGRGRAGDERRAGGRARPAGALV